jgi:hypothetical protein
VPPKKAGPGLTWKYSPHAAHFFIPCLLSELSVPWNREQTDSLTQGIIEARPRYQLFICGRPERLASTRRIANTDICDRRIAPHKNALISCPPSGELMK